MHVYLFSVLYSVAVSTHHWLTECDTMGWDSSTSAWVCVLGIPKHDENECVSTCIISVSILLVLYTIQFFIMYTTSAIFLCIMDFIPWREKLISCMWPLISTSSVRVYHFNQEKKQRSIACGNDCESECVCPHVWLPCDPAVTCLASCPVYSEMSSRPLWQWIAKAV